MFQAVIRRLLKAVAWVRFEDIPSRICEGNNVALQQVFVSVLQFYPVSIIPYPTAFPYGNGMVLHFYQQQESSTTKTVHKVINKGLKTYV